MTLSVRNGLLLIFFFIACLLFLVFGYSVYTLYQNGFYIPSELQTIVQEVNFIISIPRLGVLGIVLFSAALLSLFSIIGGGLFRRYFRKNASPMMFFFIIFIFSLAFESLRVTKLYLLVHEYPDYYGLILSRVVHFGHFLGLFSLFTSSMFFLNTTYQKIGIILGLVIVLSFVMSFSLPFDQSVVQVNLLYKIGKAREFVILIFLLGLLISSNFFRIAYQYKSNEYRKIAISIVMVVAGREACFFYGDFRILVPGLLLFMVGAIIFGKTNYELHLWA
jgi:hypothetical protein